jgi:hypothetical protein
MTPLRFAQPQPNRSIHEANRSRTAAELPCGNPNRTPPFTGCADAVRIPVAVATMRRRVTTLPCSVCMLDRRVTNLLRLANGSSRVWLTA